MRLADGPLPSKEALQKKNDEDVEKLEMKVTNKDDPFKLVE